MQPFLINRHDRLVFPANFLPRLDFSLIDDLDQLAAVIGRDFEAKALFDVLRNRRSDATELPAVELTVAEALAQPDSLVLSLASYDPDYPVYSYPQILDCNEQAAELEALNRWAMVLHNQ